MSFSICSDCKKAFDSETLLAEKIKNLSTPRYICARCEKEKTNAKKGKKTKVPALRARRRNV